MAIPGEISMQEMVEWGDSPVPLKNFVDRHGVPNIGKVVKGQYREVGVAKSVNSELYIHAVQTSQKVLAEGIKVKEGKKVVIAGNQKYSIPLTYQGWFELLSQDGKAVKAITSVADLTRAFPTSALIREAMKVFVRKDNGELTLDRTLPAGEQVNLVGAVWVTVSTPKGLVKRSMLECLDMQDQLVFMPMEQKGVFSPIAGQTNISGVHTLKGLLDKFRMPILVRLVHGVIPSKLEKHFTGVFKLNSLYTEESAFVCPMKKDAKMLPISTREPLKLVAAANFDVLKDTSEYKVQNERCHKMITSYLNSIHLLFSLPEPGSIIPRIKEDSLNKKKHDTTPEAIEEDILFDEVEDIYAYVREGGPVPPPPRPRPASAQPPTILQAPVKRTASASHNSKQHRASHQPTKSVTQTRAVSPTPLALSPGPSPTQNFQLSKDDYWEEPIYEPLDKIRQTKKSKKIEEKITVPEVLPFSAMERLSDSDLEARNNTPSTMNAPVQNLRQVYKFNSDNGPSNNAISANDVERNDSIEELQEMLQDMTPPPVPPKKYHDDNLDIKLQASKLQETNDIDPLADKHAESKADENTDNNVESSPLTKEKDLQESETTIAFEEESVISAKESKPFTLPDKSNNSQSAAPFEMPRSSSSTVVNSTIPTMPGGPPVVTVHTPQVARATVTNSYMKSNHNVALNGSGTSKPHLMSASQPALALNPTSKSPQSLSQSHELISTHQQPRTYVYTNVPPADYSNSRSAISRQNSHPKVHLNKPKENSDKQVLNQRAMPQSGALNALKPSPSKASTMQNNGVSLNRVNSNVSHKQAPFVAVARVGEIVNGSRSTELYDNRNPVAHESKRKIAQKMYL